MMRPTIDADLAKIHWSALVRSGPCHTSGSRAQAFDGISRSGGSQAAQRSGAQREASVGAASNRSVELRHAGEVGGFLGANFLGANKTRRPSSSSEDFLVNLSTSHVCRPLAQET
jgi:hypothetical protein